MSVVGVSVTLAIIFSIRYGLPNSNSSANEYAPNETRIISYSPIFCSELNVLVDTSFPDITSTTMFSVLSEKPMLTDHDMFQFNERPEFDTKENDYHYWVYYLPQGSKFGFSACKENSLSHMKFYLIKGENKFNSWVDHPRSNKAIYSNSIPQVCGSGSNASYTFPVTDDDTYYMVFYLEPGSSSSRLDVAIDVYRTKYVPVPGSNLDNCTATASCALTLPLETTYGLLTLETNVDGYWSETSSIDVYCVARVWVYVVLSLVITAFFVVIMVVIVGCCFYFVRRNRKKYAPLATPPQAIAVDAPAPNTAAFINDKGPPPPYNPSYGSTIAPKY